jgi:hypothetical protein
MVEKSAKEKTKEKALKPEAKELKFPTEGKLNKYGFIYLDEDILSAWSLKKGTEQKLSINLEGDMLTIQKV